MSRLFPVDQTTQELQRRIGQLYDHLYANAAVKTPAGIAREVGKILHAGLYAEEQLGAETGFSLDDAVLKSEKEIRAAAAAVRELYSQMKLAWSLDHLDPDIQLGDFDLCYTVIQLSDVRISSPERDVLGDALEIFRSQWTKRAGGQFFTDQQVTHLALELLDFDPRRGDDLVDICAGTGGFLLAAVERTRDLLEKAIPEGPIEEKLIELAGSSIIGQEVDAEVCSIANATLASRLPNVGGDLVACGDSLRDFEDVPRSRVRLGTHRCAATNPPFGTKITVKDPGILDAFSLARKRPDDASLAIVPRAPDILFLERNLELLQPGKGRLAIVTPYQQLSGPQTQFVRDWLLRRARPIAVIDLPPDTFQPHTGTKASLLVVERRTGILNSLAGAKDSDVFMSVPQWIGHDRRGHPMFKKAVDGRVTGELLTDFPQVSEAYARFLSGADPAETHDGTFVVPLSEVLSDPMLRLNARYYLHRRAMSSSATSLQRREGWSAVRLGDVVKRVFFPTRFRRNYVSPGSNGVPFFGGTNISQLYPLTDKWLSVEDAAKHDLAVQAGWILVTRSGSTGVVSTVPAAWEGLAISEHVIRIVPDPDHLSPEYLQLFLRSTEGQSALASGVFGSVIDEITPEHIANIDVPIPPPAELRQLVDSVAAAETSRQAAAEAMGSALRKLERFLQPSD